MRGWIVLPLVFLVACARDPAPATGTAASPAARPTSAASPSPVPAGGPVFDVVFVAADDVLNVRATPAADAALVGTLPFDARGVRATGEESATGSTRWRKIEAPRGAGWVNAQFLRPATSTAAFASDRGVDALLDQLASTLKARGDLSALTGPRGLYVFDYGSERRFAPDALPGLLASAEKKKWNAPGCGEACKEGTFHEVIGAPLAEVLAKADKEVARDRELEGGNASAKLPAKLANVRFVSVMHRGTAAHDHLDWQAFTLYLEREGAGAAWKLVAIVPDQWSP